MHSSVQVPDGGPAKIVNAMSVDVEEFFQVGAFEKCIKPEDWHTYASRVDYNTKIVLDIFAAKNIKSTFFTLGWVAERHPQLMKDIVGAGHELASHGYCHDRVHKFSPNEFRADLDKSRKILEDASGTGIKGYRAPSFSIGKANSWALEILGESGYQYSSSVAPIAHDHYGWPDAPRFAFNPFPGSPFLEIPITTVQIAGRSLSFGGGFFRLLPYQFTHWAIRRVNEHEGQSAMFYFHPWEVDPEQPRISHAPLKSRLRHYTNLSVMHEKLERISDAFLWGRIDCVYNKHLLSNSL